MRQRRTRLALEVTLFTTPERARSAAEYNTSADQNFLTDGGIRTPFDASMGGVKIINTELGISRTTWSRGPYAMLLEVNFIGEVKAPGKFISHISCSAEKMWLKNDCAFFTTE